MKYITIILLVLMSTSCMTVKRIEKNCDKFAAVCLTETEKKTVIEYKDTIIYVDKEIEVKLPADTVEIEVPLPCPELNIDPITRESGLVGVTARVDNSVLSVNAYLTDSLYITRLQDSIRVLNGIKQTVIKEINTVTVKEDTNFGKFTKKWFWGSVIIILLFVAYIVIRIYLKK